MKQKWPAWLRGSGRADSYSLPVDLGSAAFFENPAPLYAWLRAKHPIAPVIGGGFVVSRHADILAALSNPDLGNAPSRFSALHANRAAKYPAAALAANIPPFMDKPRHIPFRQALSSAFFTAFAATPEWLPDLAQAAIAPHRGRQVDVIESIARPYVCAVMARFIGINLDAPQIKEASSAFFRLFAPFNDAAEFAQANAAISTARAALAQCCAGAGKDTLIGALNGALSEQEVVDNAYLMLADGVENIEAATAICLDRLSRLAPTLWQEVGLAAAIAEVMRLCSPAQLLPRVARAPTRILGAEVGEGMPVFLALGSANLDPNAHPEPEAFLPQRLGSAALVFGAGRHRCIGAPLAMAQIETLVAAMLAAKVHPVGPPIAAYEHRFGHRWPRAMMVQVPA